MLSAKVESGLALVELHTQGRQGKTEARQGKARHGKKQRKVERKEIQRKKTVEAMVHSRRGAQQRSSGGQESDSEKKNGSRNERPWEVLSFTPPKLFDFLRLIAILPVAERAAYLVR